jgi:hypothetical protein
VSCSLVGVDPTFQKYVLPPSHHQGHLLDDGGITSLKRRSTPRLHGAVSQKALIFILADLRT